MALLLHFYLIFAIFDFFRRIVRILGVNAARHEPLLAESWLSFTGPTAEQERGNGWTEGVHAEDLRQCLETYLAAFGARRPFEMDYRLRRFDGQHRRIADFGRPFNDLDGNFAGYIGTCYDIADRKQQEEQPAYLATQDPLTGLPNRRVLEETLKRAVARARRGSTSTLILLDIKRPV